MKILHHSRRGIQPKPRTSWHHQCRHSFPIIPSSCDTPSPIHYMVVLIGIYFLHRLPCLYLMLFFLSFFSVFFSNSIQKNVCYFLLKFVGVVFSLDSTNGVSILKTLLLNIKRRQQPRVCTDNSYSVHFNGSERLFPILHRTGTVLFRDCVSPAGKRTRLAAGRLYLESLGWDAIYLAAFEKCKLALIHQATLAHRDTYFKLYLYTEGSIEIWLAISKHGPLLDLMLAHQERRHKSLAFLSCYFFPTLLRYYIL